MKASDVSSNFDQIKIANEQQRAYAYTFNKENMVVEAKGLQWLTATISHFFHWITGRSASHDKAAYDRLYNGNLDRIKEISSAAELNALACDTTFDERIKDAVKDQIGVVQKRQQQLSDMRDPIQTLASFLPPKEAARLKGVSKAFNEGLPQKVLEKQWQQQLHEATKKELIKAFGNVGEIPLPPLELIRALKEPCGFFPGKRVEETHVAVLMPQSIGGVATTLRSFGLWIKASYPRHGNATGYRYIWNQIMDQLGDAVLGKSEWVLMTKELIPGSRGAASAAQQALVAAVPGYQLPTALQATVCIYAEFAKTGRRLFDGLWTRCQEVVGGYPVVVGGFASDGLDVISRDFVADDIGAAALRKFPALGA